MKRILPSIVTITVFFILLLNLQTWAQQTQIPLPAQQTTFGPNVRGFWFVSPIDMVISGLRIPLTAGSGTQNMHLMSFPTTPPVFSASTTGYTTLSYIQGAPNGVIQTVSIDVDAGDIIGILGQAGTSTSYGPSGPYSSTIDGNSVTLTRLIYQGSITGGPAGAVSQEVGGNLGMIEVYWEHPVTVPNDAGVISVGPPGAFCPGVQNVDATIRNFGTTQIDSVIVNWAIDGVIQSPFNLVTPLDTNNGTGPNTASITLGTNNFILAQTYTIEAWTTMPNGIIDTVTFNDTSTTTLTVTVPGVNSLGASNIIDVAADIHWTELGTASQWHVELGLAGFTQGTGGKFFTTNNPHSLSGLTQNTLYDFYVRSICGPGDTSTWAGPGTFLTTCAISSAPFLENFDGASWTGPGIGTIDQCWNRNNTITPYWQVDNNGTSSSNTGPIMDASGLGNYVYLETSGGSLGDSGLLESPWVDFSATNAPELSFKYHMFGTAMGILKVQASSDGSNWTNVWSITGQQHFSDSEPWTTAIVSLASYSGDTAKVRFVGIRGSSFTSDMAIDEIRLREPPPIDIGLVAIDSPNTDCALDSIENVTLRFASFGFDTINTGTNINMYYSINGGPYVSEVYTVSSDILIGDTIPYTFTMKANLATPANYNFRAFASIVGDGDPINDTLEKIVVSIPVITSFPYFENFESGQGGWISGGVSDSWAYGTPAKNTINSASSGTKAWVTGGLGTAGYNTNEASYIVGPCYDMSSITSPIFKMDIWWASDFSWDGTQLQSSTDGGNTWAMVGNFGNPDNWYNDNTINGLVNAGFPGEGWTGTGTTSSGGWVTAKHNLSGLGGNPGVLLRVFFGSQFGNFNDGVGIDNVTVLETPNRDVGLTSIDTITTGCALGISETIAVTYSNFGIDTLVSGDTIPFSYEINGGSAVTENLILSSSLFPGDTTFYVFTTGANLGTFGQYIIKSWAGLNGDQDPSNDTLDITITNVPVITSFPYIEDFESGQGGWTSSGTNSTWAYGTPAKNTIIGASSGTNAWVTGGLGTGLYNPNEVSYVTGPCFDFTSVVRPGFDLKVWWNSEFSWDGARLEATSNAGVTWDVIGNFGDPNNWYTDNSINGMPIGQQEGWSGRATSSNGSGGWVTASNIEINFGGHSDVFLRIGFYTDGSVQDDGFAFDDFALSEDALAIDVQMDSIVPINSNCGLSATTPITVIITNYGQNTLTNIPVTYYIGGVPMATEIITNSLVGGQVFSYQFNQTADLSNPQGYILTASVNYVGDLDSANNNSPPLSVVSYQVPSVIAFTGDEVCINGPANLFANTDIGVTRWYDAAAGGTLLLTADNFPISNLTSTTTYYAEPFSPSVIPCVGIRQPVQAEVSQIPTINFTGLQTSSLTVQFTSTLSGNTDSVWWDFGDFSPGTDDPNPIHVYPSSGTKAVILQGFDGSCDTSVTNAIFILGLENGLASLIEIYPNPTPGSFQFKAADLGSSIQIQLLDQKGVVLMEQDWKSDNGKYDRKVDLPAEIPAGIYHLRIVSGDRMGRIKIVKE